MSSPASLRAPLLWLLLPFAGGLALAFEIPAPRTGTWPFAGAALASALACIALSWRGRRVLTALALITSVTLSGFSLLHLRFPYLHEWPQRAPRETTVLVQIYHEFSAAPEARSLGGLARVVDDERNDPALRGRLVYYSVIRRVSRAIDRTGTYLLQGVIEPLPRENRSGFEEYLANAAIRQRLVRARVLEEISAPGRFAAFCTAAQCRLNRILSLGLENHSSERSLYLGMVLGEKAVLTPQQESAFVRSGTFHVFSVSGLHVGVVAFALHWLLRFCRVPRRPAMVISLVVLWLYVQITGGSSPAVRAFLMSASVIARFAFQQPGNLFAALTGAALATLLVDPLQLFSTGFQMSYAVMTALILMGIPLGERWLARWKPFALLPERDWRIWHKAVRRFGKWLIVALAGGCAAFLTSVPAGIGFFGLLSTGSLLANLLVIPLSSLVINGGFISLIFGLCGLGFVSAFLNRCAALIILVMDRLLQRGVEVPGAAFEAQFRAPWLTAVALTATVALIVLCAAGRWARSRGGFWPPVALAVLILLAAVRFGPPPVMEKISVLSPVRATISPS